MIIAYRDRGRILCPKCCKIEVPKIEDSLTEKSFKATDTVFCDECKRCVKEGRWKSSHKFMWRTVTVSVSDTERRTGVICNVGDDGSMQVLADGEVFTSGPGVVREIKTIFGHQVGNRVLCSDCSGIEDPTLGQSLTEDSFEAVDLVFCDECNRCIKKGKTETQKARCEDFY